MQTDLVGIWTLHLILFSFAQTVRFLQVLYSHFLQVVYLLIILQIDFN